MQVDQQAQQERRQIDGRAVVEDPQSQQEVEEDPRHAQGVGLHVPEEELDIPAGEQEGQDDRLLLGSPADGPGRGECEQDVEQAGGVAVHAEGVLRGLPEAAADAVEGPEEGEGQRRPLRAAEDAGLQVPHVEIAVPEQVGRRAESREEGEGGAQDQAPGEPGAAARVPGGQGKGAEIAADLTPEGRDEEEDAAQDEEELVERGKVGEEFRAPEGVGPPQQGQEVEGQEDRCDDRGGPGRWAAATCHGVPCRPPDTRKPAPERGPRKEGNSHQLAPHQER